MCFKHIDLLNPLQPILDQPMVAAVAPMPACSILYNSHYWNSFGTQICINRKMHNRSINATTVPHNLIFCGIKLPTLWSKHPLWKYIQEYYTPPTFSYWSTLSLLCSQIWSFYGNFISQKLSSIIITHYVKFPLRINKHRNNKRHEDSST